MWRSGSKNELFIRHAMWSGDPPEIFDTTQADSLRTALRVVFSTLLHLRSKPQSIYLTSESRDTRIYGTKD